MGKRRIKTKEVTRAHQRVQRALVSGRLVKGPCEVCGSEEVVAHHDNYNYPLRVRWLCKTHHAEWHKEHRVTRKTVRFETLLKPKEVAEWAGVTPRTVVRWINDGKLEGTKVGRVWRVRAIDYYKFLNGQ
jgi:excisionase family DNA binding protein